MAKFFFAQHTDLRDMKIYVPTKVVVKEVVATSQYSTNDNGDETPNRTRRVVVGLFNTDLDLQALISFLTEKGLYSQLGSSGCPPKIFAYEKFIERGVVFETFEECENFLRSGISLEHMLEYSTTYTPEIK